MKILLLGSSNGREIGPMLNEHLGTEYEITSIFKSSVPLVNVEDLGKLGKMTLSSELILLQWEGQETAWIEITSIQLKRTSASL